MRLAVAIIVASPALAFAQKPIVLAKPDAEHAEPFSMITGVRELRDGRVLVSDNKDKVVLVIDFKGGSVKLGREGAGPGEYALPNAIAALPADSSAIWDGGNRRYLMILPDARLGREFRLEPPEGLGPAGYGAFAATTPRGVDARGNIYFQGSPFVSVGDGPAPADSIPVIKFDRARQRPETVAYVRPPKGNATVTAAPGRGVSVTNGLANPLVPLDAWAVLPDGKVAVLHGDPYRMDVYAARTAKTSGPSVPFEKLRVDGAMKQSIIAQRKRQLAGAAPRTRPGGGDAQNFPSGMLKQLMNLEPWPEYAPPFMRDAVIARPLGATGQVWVLRVNRTEAEPARYDVFDGAGRVVARVELPPKSRIVAFGNGTAYAVRTDDDELQYLQRYRLPNI